MWREPDRKRWQRWENNVKVVVQEIWELDVDHTRLTVERDRWWAVVCRVIHIGFSYKAWAGSSFLASQ